VDAEGVNSVITVDPATAPDSQEEKWNRSNKKKDKRYIDEDDEIESESETTPVSEGGAAFESEVPDSVREQMTVSVTQILRHARFRFLIDYLTIRAHSLDHQLNIIEGIDFSRYLFHAIVVTKPSESVHRILTDNNYKFVCIISASHAEALYIHYNVMVQPNTYLIVPAFNKYRSIEMPRWDDKNRTYLLSPTWKFAWDTA